MERAAWGETFGDAEYTFAFETLIAGSVEKIQTAMALGRMLIALNTSSLCRHTPGRARLIVDIGSHDGATLQNVLQQASGLDRVRLFGLDYKPDAASSFEDRFRGDVNSLPAIEHAKAVAGNAFGGDVGTVLGIDKGSADIVLVSHVLYGVDAANVQILIDDIAGTLLADRGVAFFVHVSEAGSTLVSLRNAYGGRAERDIAASADKIRCAPTAIAAAVEQSGVQLRSIAYPVKTYFEKMTDAEWGRVETATDFASFAGPAARNIARIAFIALATPPSLAAAKDGRDWRALTQEVRRCVQGTETENRGGFIEDRIVLQVLFSSEIRDGVDAILRDLGEAMPRIQRDAEASLLRRFGGSA